MKAVLGVLLAVSACSHAALCIANEVAKNTPEAALNQAKSNRVLAHKLWRTNWEACAIGGTLDLATVMHEVNKALRLQPLTADSRFGSCKQLLMDVSFANGACYTGLITDHELTYVKRRWAEDNAACNWEIVNPDLQAKPDKEQTEAQWEASERASGTADDDIQFMKELRSK